MKPFTDELSSVQQIEIGSAETAYTSSTGETYILVINEGLIFGERLEHSLLTPNQMRANGITVEDTPTQFDRRSKHAIIGTDNSGTEVVMPLLLRGMISYLPTHYPTEEEQRYCRRIILTSDAEWDPYCDSYSAAETRCTSSAITDTHQGEQLKVGIDPVGIMTHQGDTIQLFETMNICAASRDFPPELSPISENTSRIISSVNIASDDYDGDGTKGWQDPSVADVVSTQNRAIMAAAISDKKSVLTKEILAKRWDCGLESARKTLLVTTQHGIRHVIHPYDRRYKTTFDHLRFPGLRDKFYSDTMFSKIKSINNNICCQVFTNGKGDTHCYPYHRKAKVGGSLMDFINDIGMVPNHIVTDNAKESTLEEWKSTVDKFKIKYTMSESYSQW